MIDLITGHIATAKHLKLWRALLVLTAHRTGGAPNITLPTPSGWVADPSLNQLRLGNDRCVPPHVSGLTRMLIGDPLVDLHLV